MMNVKNSNKEARAGCFISVEGSEGSGKSTNIQFLGELLQAKGITFTLTREPGGTRIGEQLREILLSPEQNICDRTELMLMFAARAQHVETVIRPALEKGHWVLCDRFTDATYAYQGGGRGMSSSHIHELEQWTLAGFQPDHTFLLDVPVSIGMQRVRERGALDRFEQEKIEFFERVRGSYLTLAKNNPERITVIDASQTLDKVGIQLSSVLESFMNSITTHGA